VTRSHYGTLAVTLLVGVIFGAVLAGLTATEAHDPRRPADPTSVAAAEALVGDPVRGYALLEATDMSYLAQKCSGDVQAQDAEAFRSWTEQGLGSLTEAMNLQGLLIVMKMTDERELFASLDPFADPYIIAQTVNQQKNIWGAYAGTPREIVNCLFAAAPRPALASEIGLAWSVLCSDGGTFKVGTPDELLAALMICTEPPGFVSSYGKAAANLQTLISLFTFRGLGNMTLADAIRAADRNPTFIRYPDEGFAKWDHEDAMVYASSAYRTLSRHTKSWQTLHTGLTKARLSTGTARSPLSLLFASLETDTRRRAELAKRQARARQGAADIAAFVATAEKNR
jgi:hypothetical protein